MAKPIWQQKIVAQLEASPLCIVKGSPTSVVKHVACLSPSEKAGAKITLRYITNYTGFNKCATCGKEVR